MAQFRFIVDGDFVDFYDGAMHAFRVRNTTQDVDWYYETAPGIKFEVDGHRYNTVPSQIEIDGVTLSANEDFDDAIVGIFPNLASSGGPGGTPGIDDVLAEEQIVVSRFIELQPDGLFEIVIGSTRDLLELNTTVDAEHSLLQATNISGDGSAAFVKASTQAGEGTFLFKARYGADQKVASIEGFVDATTSTLTFNGDIQYNGNAKLLSNITMNLDGHLFEMLNAEGLHGVLVADATVGAERTYIQATNDANGGSFALLSAETNETQTLVTLQSDFQDGTKDAQLVLRTASGESTITHSADTHTFNAGGASPNLSIQLGNSFLAGYNSTGDGNTASFDASAGATEVNLDILANFNDGVKMARIEAHADATTATLTATGDFIIADLAGGGTTGLSIDNDGKIIRTP